MPNKKIVLHVQEPEWEVLYISGKKIYSGPQLSGIEALRLWAEVSAYAEIDLREVQVPVEYHYKYIQSGYPDLLKDLPYKRWEWSKYIGGRSVKGKRIGKENKP